MYEFQIYGALTLTPSYENLSTNKEQMLENLSWCQIYLYTQHANSISNIADMKYEKNGAHFRDLGFLTVDVTSSIYYMYDWVLMKKRLKIANDVLPLLASG